jgi:hypothetical protein
MAQVKVSIGVCLGPGFNREWLHNLIGSIKRQIDPENHEILLIGGDPDPNEFFDGCRLIPFDETVKSGWITRKKNILASEAKYDKLVITHDYYSFSPYWYEGIATYTEHHPDWRVLFHQIRTAEGYRSADWLVHPVCMNELLNAHPEVADVLMSVAPNENHPRYVCGLPYHMKDLTHTQYIPGGYFFVDREVVNNVPLDETRCWGEYEDVEWSERVISAGYKFEFVMNPEVYVTIQKPNKWRLFEMPPSVVQKLRDIYESTL